MRTLSRLIQVSNFNTKIETILCLLCFVATGFNLQGQSVLFPEPLSSRTASYDIDVQLDIKKKMIFADEKIHWLNSSTDTVRELQLHLYLNAFKNTQSTFMKEQGGASRGESTNKEDENVWGWQEITRFQDSFGNDLLVKAEYIQPDDDNEEDQSVIRIPLKEGVLPGQRVTYDLSFEAKLPNLIARTGYDKNYYFLVHWFPKLGVYEYPGIRYAEKGQWNCHQFHASTEFYADFGVYNVNIAVPKGYTLAASGLLQGTEEKDSLTIHKYRAEDVIDFAWTASPRMMEFHDKWKDVDLKVMANEEHIELVPRFFQATKNCLEYLDKHVGDYPYSNLTVVLPPFHGLGSSGMEYPTLVSGIGFKGLPDYIRIIEVITTHEVTHQYFMQMIATNEMEESWMDEGFTSYWESRIMDHYYGEKTSNIEFLSFGYGGMQTHRLEYLGLSNPKVSENFRFPWKFKHGGYHPLTYAKTCLWLKTLEGLVGFDHMNGIMKKYFEEWKFKHPCAKDFIAVVNNYVAENLSEEFPNGMDWFFDQVLYSSELCDYNVGWISNNKDEKDYGVFENTTEWGIEEGEGPEEIYTSKVVLFRKGEVIMPQEVLIHFDNGEEILEKWDGTDRSFEFEYKGTRQIEWAILDPQKKIYMDSNLNDNSYAVEIDQSPIWKTISKFFFWVQNTMQTMSSLI